MQLEDVWSVVRPIHSLTGLGLSPIDLLMDGYPFVNTASMDQVSLPQNSPEPKLNLHSDLGPLQRLEQTETELRDRERRFYAVFNQTFQFMALLEPNGTLVEVNQTALQWAGVTADQVLHFPFWQTPWWQSLTTQQSLREVIQRVAQGEFVRDEFEMVGVDSAIAIVDLSVKPIYDETEQVVLLIVEGRDITKRKQAEAEVQRLNAELEQRVVERTAELEASNRQKETALVREQEARALYTTLTKLSPVGIFRCDAQGSCLYVNERWCEITGLTPEQAYGDGWRQAVHPDDQNRVNQEAQIALQTNSPLQIEFRCRHADGWTAWVFGQAIADVDERGEVLGFVGTLTDITERKRWEQDLQESQERFRATFEQAAVGIAHIAPDGRWLRVNQKLCEILGYSREAILARNFQELTHPDDLQMDLEQFQQLLAGTIETYSTEKRYLRRNGVPVWIDLTVSAVRDPQGEVKYLISVIEEINERKQAEIALQERAIELTQLNTVLSQTTALLQKRNQELDQFAYVASHDLKAPLRAIANLSEWIEEDLSGQLPEENQQQLQLLRGRVHRMESLINGLLEYSRIGRTEAIDEQVNVTTLIHEVLDSLAPPSSFVIELAPDLPTFSAKRLPLSQVFANLIGNAIKHHDQAAGNIQISVQDREQVYEFAVADDGPGIAPEYHDKVFAIFQTLDSRDNKESTGIGLSIVKKILETEGGTITLESGLQQGTTFRFTWPKLVVK